MKNKACFCTRKDADCSKCQEEFKLFEDYEMYVYDDALPLNKELNNERKNNRRHK